MHAARCTDSDVTAIKRVLESLQARELADHAVLHILGCVPHAKKVRHLLNFSSNSVHFQENLLHYLLVKKNKLKKLHNEQLSCK